MLRRVDWTSQLNDFNKSKRELLNSIHHQEKRESNWGKDRGIVCIRHGAKQKTCSHEGCRNVALKGGVHTHTHTRHGANCQEEDLQP